jgi:peptide/nickel transport system substrate-binding protein
MKRALASALLASAAAGCAAPPGDEGFRTNTIRAHLTSEPASLSLIGKTDYNSEVIASLISDGLVRYDAALAFEPMLATSWELSADHRTVTFHLRDGVRWQDGRPVTARDVVYTVRKILEPATEARSWRPQFANLVSIDALDERTVRATYAEPHADFLDAWRIPIVPEHLASKDPDFLTGEFAKRPIGCGPFRLARHEPGQLLVLEANRDYWGGPPTIDRISFRVVPSDRTTYEALLRGDLDLYVGVTPDLWREALRSPRAARLARFVYPRLSVWHICWNVDGSNPFFGDPRVRRALVLALDRDRFARQVANGLGVPAATTYHPDTPWADPEVRPWPYEPAEARRLLEEAGWTDRDGDGVRERAGTVFRFTLLLPASPQELADRIALWTQQSLAEVGVRMEIEKLEPRAFYERRRAHQFQATMSSFLLTPAPDQFELYHSSARENGMNYGGFSDPEVDRLLEEGRRTFEPSRRKAIYSRLQRRLHELEPISCLFHWVSPVLYDARLRGIELSPIGPFLIVPGPRRWRWAGR